jgi:hypothetical protein
MSPWRRQIPGLSLSSNDRFVWMVNRNNKSVSLMNVARDSKFKNASLPGLSGDRRQRRLGAAPYYPKTACE